MKEQIIKTFEKDLSCLRVVFATIAFGLGLDIPESFILVLQIILKIIFKKLAKVVGIEMY